MSSRSDGTEFYFVQTMPMEEKRRSMGWAVDERKIPYLILYYEDEDRAKKLIENSDVVLFGWTEGLTADLEKKRLSSGKLSFRVSERIYREGQWKAVSPRGLVKKYHEHFVYRKKPVYLLCTGAYVASDFNLIKSYPGKKLKWGYFPDADRGFRADQEPTKDDEASEPDSGMSKENTGCASNAGGKKADMTSISAPASGERIAGHIRMCWAGRLIALKHPEFAIRVAGHLRENGRDFLLDIVGDGPLRESLEAEVKSLGLEDCVTFTGSLPPDKVLAYMDRADIFLFTSNYLEGWGAVVNEAMQRRCAVVASLEAGAVPFLIKDGSNGLVYKKGSYDDFESKVDFLFDNREKIGIYAYAARKTIKKLWNAENAATELVRFCREFLDGKEPSPAKHGPLSVAKNIPAPGFMRTLQETNKLE